MSSSFSVVKPSYLENTNNIIVNGNLTVNGTVSNYLNSFGIEVNLVKGVNGKAVSK